VRYYVLVTSEDRRVNPHIIAEVVRDVREEGADRRESLAGQIAGPRGSILTKEEILGLGEGPRILGDWQSGKDNNFYMEAARLSREADQVFSERPVLRIVGYETGTLEVDARPPSSDDLLRRAAELQLQSAALIQRARARVASWGGGQATASRATRARKGIAAERNG